MPYTYMVDLDTGTAILKGEGSLNDEETLEFVKRLIADPDFRRATKIFADMRGVDLQVTRKGIEALVRARSETAPGSVRTAVLVDHPLVYGMTRMYGTLAEDFNHNVRAFEDEDAAHAWLSG